MKRYSMPSHMPDKFPFIDRKMWEKPKMDIVERLNDDTQCFCSIRKEAADEIERLREALENLLTEAEDVFVCMADATGIDRHNYPKPYLDARSALQQKETD